MSVVPANSHPNVRPRPPPLNMHPAMTKPRICPCAVGAAMSPARRRVCDRARRVGPGGEPDGGRRMRGNRGAWEGVPPGWEGLDANEELGPCQIAGLSWAAKHDWALSVRGHACLLHRLLRDPVPHRSGRRRSRAGMTRWPFSMPCPRRCQ
jgi:hypothetical protein